MLEQKGIKILDDSFEVRSFLADYIGNSFLDLQLLKAYTQLNREVILYQSISRYSLLEAKNHIKGLIKNSDHSYSMEQYIHSVEPLLFYLFPNEYVHYQRKTIASGVSAKINRGNPIKIDNKLSIIKEPEYIIDPPKPKKIVQPIFTSISIGAVCRSLFITQSENDEFMILRDNKDVTLTTVSSIKHNTKRISIYDKGHDYTIMLPKRKYERFKCTYHGKSFSIASSKTKRMVFREIELSSVKGDTAIIADSESIAVTQNKGTIFYDGYMNHIHIRKDKTKVDCIFKDKSIQKRLYILSHKAIVKGEFPGYRIKPKVNSTFGKNRRVKGTYYINKEKLFVDISTRKGDIFIK